jgi:hypothetical protein
VTETPHRERTKRPARHRAVIHVASEDLARLLDLPDDVDVATFQVDPIRDCIVFLLESDRFEPVTEGAWPPHFSAQVAVEAKGGGYTRRVTWPELDEAGYVVSRDSDAFARIYAAATSLQSDLDADPDLQADPAIAGEIEGLWQALRLLDEPRWQVLYEEAKSEKARAVGD